MSIFFLLLIFCLITKNGEFDRENFEAGRSMPSLPGDSIAAAVCASTWVEPHGRCTVAFGLSWSSPKVKFQKGCSYNRSDVNALMTITLVILTQKGVRLWFYA